MLTLAAVLLAIARRLEARMPRLARRLGSAGLGIELYRESCDAEN